MSLSLNQVSKKSKKKQKKEKPNKEKKSVITLGAASYEDEAEGDAAGAGLVTSQQGLLPPPPGPRLMDGLDDFAEMAE